MSLDRPARPPHRRTVSYPIRLTRQPQETHMPVSRPTKQSVNHLESSSTQQRPRAASRLMSSVKRTLASSSSAKRRSTDNQTPIVLSTPAETSASTLAQHFRDPEPSSSRPTIEQIAMGLHVSRTPHLRPSLVSSPYAFPQASPASRQYEHRSQIALPPPPSRSSMKKTSVTDTLATSSSGSPMISPPFSSASASTTTITSVTPSSTAVQSVKTPGIGMGFKNRMARLLPHGRSSSAPTSLRNSPNGSPRASFVEGKHHILHQQTKKAVRFHTEEPVGSS